MTTFVSTHRRLLLLFLVVALLLTVLVAPASAGTTCSNTYHTHYYPGIGYVQHYVYSIANGWWYWRAAWVDDPTNYWYLGSIYCGIESGGS